LILIKKLLTYAIALVWFINGLYCKILGLVPRHEQIVAQILGEEYASILIILIGLAELVMVVWILSGWQRRWCAIAQIVVVLSMNILETTLVHEFLLWGYWNGLFALIFVLVVYYWGIKTNTLGSD
jgi:hypothetical protein